MHYAVTSVGGHTSRFRLDFVDRASATLRFLVAAVGEEWQSKCFSNPERGLFDDTESYATQQEDATFAKLSCSDDTLCCASMCDSSGSANNARYTECVQPHLRLVPRPKRRSYTGWEDPERARPGFEDRPEPYKRTTARDHQRWKRQHATVQRQSVTGSDQCAGSVCPRTS